eukprot:8270585-Ditylum_brightwellii.AAC.1
MWLHSTVVGAEQDFNTPGGLHESLFTHETQQQPTIANKRPSACSKCISQKVDNQTLWKFTC